MKFLIFSILIFLFSLKSYGQTDKLDQIIKQSGDTVRGKVINISDYDITFTYPNEPLTYTLNKNQIKEIKFSSGRIEKIDLFPK